MCLKNQGHMIWIGLSCSYRISNNSNLQLKVTISKTGYFKLCIYKYVGMLASSHCSCILSVLPMQETCKIVGV